MRISLFLVPLLVVLSTTTAYSIEPHLFGAKVTRRDFVGAKVVSNRGRVAVIDLGYEHGVLKGSRFWVFRQFRDRYQLVNTLQISSVKRKTSVGAGIRKTEVRRGDTVVIAAAKLELWFGTSEKEALLLRRRYVESEKRGYDTKDRAPDAEDLLERQPSNRLKLKAWNRRIAKLRPAGATYWDTAQLRLKRREFMSAILLYDLGRVVGEGDETAARYWVMLGDVGRYVTDPAAALQPLIKVDPQQAVQPESVPAPQETDSKSKPEQEEKPPAADLIARKIAEIVRARRKQKF